MHRTVKAALLAGLIATAAATSAEAATARYVPGRVIVKYAPGTTAAQKNAVSQSTGLLGRLGSVLGTGAQVLRVVGDPQAVAARLNRSAHVLYAEPDMILKATAVPNDPRFGELYGLNDPSDNDVDAPEGWDLAGLGGFPSTGGPLVGVIDHRHRPGARGPDGQDRRLRRRDLVRAARPARRQPGDHRRLQVR